MHVMNVCVVAERGCDFGREINCVSNSSLCLSLVPPGNSENMHSLLNLKSFFSVSSRTHAGQENCVCEWIHSINLQCGNPSCMSRAGAEVSSCGVDLMVLPQERWQE